MTGRPCLTCRHPARDAIEAAWVLRRDTQARIAGKHGLNRDAVQRHMEAHVSEERRREIVVNARLEQADLIDQEINDEQIEVSSGLTRIVREITLILERAKGEDDALALTALRDMRGTLMDLAKVYGQLQERTTLSVTINEAPEWLRLRAILADVFRQHPEAGKAFLERAQRERLSIAHDTP